MGKFSGFGETARGTIKNIFAMFIIFLSGLFMAIAYWVMAAVMTAFESVNCLINDNLYFSTCQEWFAISIYPFLSLNGLLVWISYFYIFGVVFGLFYMGYKMRRHPSLLIVHILFSILVTYLSIEIANVYRVLLANDFLYSILQPFPIYNKIMLYFPAFMFFVVFVSGLIGLLGIWKDKDLESGGNLQYQ